MNMFFISKMKLILIFEINFGGGGVGIKKKSDTKKSNTVVQIS